MFRVFSIAALIAALTSTSGCVCTAPFQGIWCLPEPAEQVTPLNTPSGSDNGGSSGGSSYNGPGAN